MMGAFLILSCALSCASGAWIDAAGISAHDVGVSLCARIPVVARHSCLSHGDADHLLLLRGGADDADDLEEDDLVDDEDAGTDVAAAGDAIENPFLGMPGAGAGGGLGLEGLESTLKDPKMLQEALKELQDPAVQQQVKAMMEDPAFQQSMKQYMEQITQDPQFEKLKEQTEQMLQQEGFMEQMTKAIADMGSALGELPAGGGEDDSK